MPSVLPFLFHPLIPIFREMAIKRPPIFHTRWRSTARFSVLKFILFFGNKDHIALMVNLDKALVELSSDCDVSAILRCMIAVCLVHDTKVGGRMFGDKIYQKHFLSRERPDIPGMTKKINVTIIPLNFMKFNIAIWLTVWRRCSHHTRLCSHTKRIVYDL